MITRRELVYGSGLFALSSMFSTMAYLIRSSTTPILRGIYSPQQSTSEMKELASDLNLEIYINETFNIVQVSGFQGTEEFKNNTKLELTSTTRGPNYTKTQSIDSTNTNNHTPPPQPPENTDTDTDIFTDKEYWDQFTTVQNESNGASNVRTGIIDGNYNTEQYNVHSSHSTINTQIPFNAFSKIHDSVSEHGKKTSNTLFHQNPTISHKNNIMRGFAHNADKYHFMLDYEGSTNSISFIEGLTWILHQEIDVLGIALAPSEDPVLQHVFTEFLKRSNCITIIGAGNGDICDTNSYNYLTKIDSSKVIRVGAYSTRHQKALGSTETADIITLSDIHILNTLQYSGTSSAGTIVTGLASQYLGILKQQYSHISDNKQKEIVKSSILSSNTTIEYSHCDIPTPLLEPENGLQTLHELATQQ